MNETKTVTVEQVAHLLARMFTNPQVIHETKPIYTGKHWAVWADGKHFYGETLNEAFRGAHSHWQGKAKLAEEIRADVDATLGTPEPETVVLTNS